MSEAMVMAGAVGALGAQPCRSLAEATISTLAPSYQSGCEEAAAEIIRDGGKVGERREG